MNAHQDRDRRTPWRLAAVLIATGMLPACAQTDPAQDDDGQSSDEGETDAESSGGGDLGLRPNWHEDIAPLVAFNCAGCHRDEGIAFAMDQYEATRPYAEIMAHQTAERTMPPWHAIETDECQPEHPLEHDARLTDAEVALFADWVEVGTPLGDPARAAAIAEPPAIDLLDPTVVLPMTGSVTVEREGNQLDFFHCLSLDPGNAQDVFLDGLQVIPGNGKIAHHVLAYVDAEAQSAGWTNGILEECDGGPGVTNATLVGGWVPGALPIEPPDGVGIRLPAGARIVLNMHYHVDPMQPQVDDATALALRYTTEVPPWVSEFRLLGAPGLGQAMSGELFIPAGEADHVESFEWTVPPGTPPLRIWAVGHHMHKVGVDMKTTIVRLDGSEACLLQTPAWDFNWQRLYEYDVPVADTVLAQPGDVVRLRCTYDNTLNNPGVVAALAEVGLREPQGVVLGESTLDEMCVTPLGFAVQP